MSFENTSVADPKALKNMMARFNTEEGYQSLIKSAGSVVAMDRVRAKRYLDLLSSYCQKQPLLLSCTPASLWQCMKTAAAFGLEPGLLGMLYIVPFKNHGTYEAQVILGYRGLIELTRRSKAVKCVEAFLVYEADLRAPGKFEVILGLNPDIVHVPNWRASHSGQKPIGAYCVSTMADGNKTFTFMTDEEIEAIRSRSRAKDSGPWVTDPGEMYRKSVTRRHCKYLPVSVEDLTLIDAARQADFDVDPTESQVETRGGVPISSSPIEVGDRTAGGALKLAEGTSETAPEKAAGEQAGQPMEQAQTEQQLPLDAPAEVQAQPEQQKPAQPVVGTQGMKEAIARKRGRPRKSGAEVPASDVPPEPSSGAESAQSLPNPAPEAPVATEATAAAPAVVAKAAAPVAAPAAVAKAAAPVAGKKKWILPDDEDTKESEEERILRYAEELSDQEIPSAVITGRANFCWVEIGDDDEQKKLLTTMGFDSVDDIMKNDTGKTRKNIIIAAATVVQQRRIQKAEAPKAEAPKAAAPKAEAPKAAAPKAEAPKAAAPKAEAPKAAAPKAEASKAEAPKADLDPVVVRVDALLEGYHTVDLETLRKRAKDMVALAREVRPESVDEWFASMMIEKYEDLDVIGQVGLGRLLGKFARELKAKP